MKWKAHRYVLLSLSWPFFILLMPYHFVDQLFKIAADWTEKFGFFRFLRSLEAIAIAAALVLFWLDLQDRQADRDNRAWSLIASVSGVENVGNAGLGNALEILNNDGIILNEIYLPGAWLSVANLPGANLSGADLSGANLSKANLSRADFKGTDLSEADLRGTNLSGADLTEADLSDADFTGANLTKAYLSWVNLRGAILKGANLSGTDFTGVNLSGVNLSEADLRGVNLSGVNLSEADLRGANLSGVNLSWADLRETNLSGADFRLVVGLTQDQIKSACSDKIMKVSLPNGIEQPPECPSLL